MRRRSFRNRVVCLAAWSIIALVHAGCTVGTDRSPSTGKPATMPSQTRVPSLAELPPRVREITLTPIKSNSTASNAELLVRYETDVRLSDIISVNVGDRRVGLKRIADGKNQYRAIIGFDFEAYAREQERRAELARRFGSIPVFRGREMIGARKIQFVSPASIRDAWLHQTALHINPADVSGGIPANIHASRELLITDLSVVSDKTRTFDTCADPADQGNPDGAWTFAKLMRAMANKAQTNVDPADFVEQWLKTWEQPRTINGWTVDPRPRVDDLVLNNWPRLNGKLDLAKSPFRLMAIVNRIDLRQNVAYGGGNAGEVRFVFALKCSTSDISTFMVIFEYGVPISGCTAVRDWGEQWHQLGSMTIGSTSFNSALQSLTDKVTNAGADLTKPNGSALNQIRTNESAFRDPPDPENWELREFHIDDTDHQLHQVVVKQAPDSGLNFSAVIADYLNQNQQAILPPELGGAGNYQVPLQFPSGTHFLGGSSRNVGQLLFWNDVHGSSSAINSNDARNQFSLGTCNACHGGETRTLSFLHIKPNATGVAASVSKFLVGDGTLSSPSTFTMPDPVVSAQTRTYGDLVRRGQELDALLSSTCGTARFIDELVFVPPHMTH